MENGGFRIIPERTIKYRLQWSVLILSLLTVGGMVFCLQGMFMSRMSYLPVAACSVLACSLSFWLGRKRRRFLIGAAAAVLILLILGFILADALAAGTMNFLNQILAQYNYISGNAIDYFVVPDFENMQLAYFIFMTYLIIFLAFYLGEIIHTKHPLILFLCWLPLLAGSVLLKITLGGLSIAWAAVSIIGTFAYSQTFAGEDTDNAMSDGGGISYSGGAESGSDRVYAGTLLVLLALMSLWGVIYYQVSDYQPSERIAALKENVQGRVEHTRFGEPDYPEGDLKKQIHSSDEVRLKVGLSAHARLYLKGYTGSIFEDERWFVLDPTSYSEKYEGMIKDYVKKGFHPLSQLNCYIQVADRIPGAQVPQEEIMVSVENVSASRKYIYLPYGVSYEDLSGLEGIKQDINVLAGSGEQETMTYQVNATAQDALIGFQGAAWLNDAYDMDEVTGNYRITERDYHAFAEEHYLDISEEEQEEYESTLPKLGTDLSEITDTVRLTLSEQGEAQTSWSSADYATRGTLMYRYYGVPARYVEGYLADGEGTVEVKASDAHAWVEIYKDGLGWIPVDVTPGFYQDLPEQDNTSVQQQTASGQDNVEQQQTVQEEAPSEEKAFPWWLIFCIILAVLVLLLLIFISVLWIRRQMVYKKRVEEMSQEDLVLQMKALSSYLYDLTAVLQMSEEELSGQVRQILSVLWYSLDPAGRLQQEDAQTVRAAVKELQEAAWKDATRRKRLWLRYWKYVEYPV